MHSADDVFQDLEGDRDQREAEIRLLENIAARSSSDLERNMLSRSLALLIYAHLEGFCKFALLAYYSCSQWGTAALPRSFVTGAGG